VRAASIHWNDTMFKHPITAAIAVCLIAMPIGVYAQDHSHGVLEIGHPWSRPTPPGAPTAAGYLTITNTGREGDVLLGGSSPLADKIEVHQMTMAGGIMRMRAVSGGLPIPAGQTVKLEPNGYHLMLIGPKHAFRLGEHIAATLRFQRAGAVKVEFEVLAAAPGGEQPMSMDVH
jgi:copper(I)-binding protein